MTTSSILIYKRLRNNIFLLHVLCTCRMLLLRLWPILTLLVGKRSIGCHTCTCTIHIKNRNGFLIYVETTSHLTESHSQIRSGTSSILWEKRDYISILRAINFRVDCGKGKYLIDPTNLDKDFWNYPCLGNNFLEYNCLS